MSKGKFTWESLVATYSYHQHFIWLPYQGCPWDHQFQASLAHNPLSQGLTPSPSSQQQ